VYCPADELLKPAPPRPSSHPPSESPLDPGPDPRATYRKGLDRESQAAAGRDESRRLTTLRGAVFTAFLACLVLTEMLQGTGRLVALAAGGVLLVAFVMLVQRHRRVRREIAEHEVLAGLHEAGLARLDRDWDALDAAGFPEGPEAALEAGHPYGPDLHIFGHASLFRLAGPVLTAPGRQRLGSWLASPAPPTEIARRQEAVRALVPEFELRMRLAAEGIEGPPERPHHVDALVKCANSPSDRIPRVTESGT
jgi:hypothetical protein